MFHISRKNDLRTYLHKNGKLLGYFRPIINFDTGETKIYFCSEDNSFEGKYWNHIKHGLKEVKSFYKSRK